MDHNLRLITLACCTLALGNGCEQRPVPYSLEGDTVETLGDEALPADFDAAIDTAITDTPVLPVALPDQMETELPADTGVLRATTAELAALSKTLRIPVQGVTPAQLHDTYSESRGTRVHEAIDILAPRRTPVLSATKGRLLKLFNSKPGGLMIYATDETEHFILLYGHLDGYAPGMTNGMKLERGQVIGYVGTTGNAPPGTPHLHFGILRGRPSASWSKGEAVNPYPLLMSGAN
jgi:murein DD-endopeptidase MepM/ murein hydrolase activator NlpD